ncbi:5'-3' exonuclease [Mycoplasma todarodis]|uniref:5'-3' exonuclease n=1 Tax=Mycoplasma todarodis TaxID=1937191 RepID=UPI003B2C26FC
MNKILLIDGNSLTYRGYFATAFSRAGILTTSDGIPTNAVLSMNNMLSNIIYTESPTHILIAFDAKKKTRRHDIFPDYKGGRSKTPQELIQQFPIVKEMIEKMGIKWYEVEGWEADDIIATVAKQSSEAGHKVQILSSDKDLLQLVDENIEVLFNNKGVRDLNVITNDNFFETQGHFPNQVADMKGLVGDSSDNLPGVKGIGIKGANKLLEKYGTVENIYRNIEEITGATQTKLINDKEMAMMCRDIATLKFDVEIPYTFDELAYRFRVTQELIDFYQRYELKSLVNKFSKYKSNTSNEESISENAPELPMEELTPMDIPAIETPSMEEIPPLDIPTINISSSQESLPIEEIQDDIFEEENPTEKEKDEVKYKNIIF